MYFLLIIIVVVVESVDTTHDDHDIQVYSSNHHSGGVYSDVESRNRRVY